MIQSLQRRLTWITDPNYPFRPSQVPLFYGWIILIVTTLGIVMSIPGQTAGVSVFTDRLIEANGISRLALSNTYLLGTLASGLLLPLGGVYLDRWGARLVVVMSSMGLGLTLLVLSQSDRLSDSLSQMLGTPLMGTRLVILALGFISLRFNGQGMLTMVSQTTLGKWFDRRRGLVSGTAGILASFSFAGAPLALSALIGWFGWREAWQVMAIAVGVGMASIGWLFYRDNPESCGLVMDGTSSAAAETTVAIAPCKDFTRPEALRTLAFWGVALALSSQSLIITGITFHIVDIGALAGLPEASTVALFVPISVVSMVMGYLVGMLSDRVPLRLLFMLMMVAQAVGISSLASLDLPVMRAIATVALGISGGCFGTLSTVTLPRFFGRTYLGAIAGVQMMCMVLGSAIGPSFLATFKEIFGSYHVGLYVACLIPLTLLGLLTFAHNPQPDQTSR